MIIDLLGRMENFVILLFSFPYLGGVSQFVMDTTTFATMRTAWAQSELEGVSPSEQKRCLAHA